MMVAQSQNWIEQAAIYIFPLVASITLTYSLFNLARDLRKAESKKVRSRLREPDSLDESAAERAAKDSILRKTQSDEGLLGPLIAKLRFVTQIQEMLERANISWQATTFLINLVGLSAVAYITCYFLNTSVGMRIGVCLTVGLGPILVIYVRMKRRLSRFLNQLPDVFELMSQALRAGHSLANAILLVSQQLHDPVGTEFARVFHEQNLGIKIEDALKDMGKRVGLMDVRFFVTAVLIQRQTGGDLAEVLDNISGVIRERIKLFGSVKALTAEGRLSGYVLLALPVVVFIVELVINPNYAQVMLDEPMGQYMLIGAGISQILGLCMIQKIIRIKV